MLNKNTKILIQGLGKQGIFHSKLMENIVVGVNPNLKEMGFPVYKTIKEALSKHKVDWSVIFVPAKNVKDAAMEALSNNLNIVIITEGVPVHDTMEILKNKDKNIVIGPNCPGLISVDECKIGIMPEHIFKKGNIGIVSRSGTLTYEIVNELSKNGLGQSTVIGIGGDSVIGFDFIDALKFFEEDKETKKIILIGEIGGNLEEEAAKFIKNNISKKVVAYIAGRSAPEGKKMGHAGAIISKNSGRAEDKIKAFESNGVKVARLPSEIVKLL